MNSSPPTYKKVESPTSSDWSRLDQHPLPIAATEPTPSRGGRALVLGGGGSSGNAWSIGIIAGLAHAGLHLERANLIVGTSAGATTAAQITGMPPAKLYTAMLATTPQPPPGPAGPGDGRASTGPVIDQLERTGRIIVSAADAADMRRKMGVAAIELDAESDDSRQTHWRATVAARLPSHQWPERTLLITAVDADTGEPVVFDRYSGVDLVDAVAASCSSGAAYRIGDRRYIDGGYRRNENADLAAGYERVLVLSPFGGRSRHPLAWGMHLAAQVDELRAGGSRVETIMPERAAEHMFGANAMDASLRLPAARAGFDQGKAIADEIVALRR